MSQFLPDDSFVRDGRTLEEWLWRLVDDVAVERIRAGEALQAMDWGLPSIHTDWSDLSEFPDTESQVVRFSAELKRVVAQPHFEAARFLERLGAWRIAWDEDWRRRCDAESKRSDPRTERYDRIFDRLVDLPAGARGDETRACAGQRLIRLSTAYYCGLLEGRNNPLAQAESLAASAVVAFRITRVLDREWLSAPEVLEAFLSSSGSLRSDALGVLCRIGPRAVGFAPRLIEDLDRLSQDERRFSGFDAAGALGAIGRDDAEIVPQMISRLAHPALAVRRAALDVLQHLGTAVCGREREICDRIWPLMDQTEERPWAITALASVGRDLPSVRAAILQLARPSATGAVQGPVADEEYPDPILSERGLALSAMECFTAYPEECVPILVEAMDSFEEFDPDWTYSGPLGRVAAVVAEFGAGARAAVLPLVAHLNDEPEGMPKAILEALARIGPSARPALPALHDLRRATSEGDLADLDRQVVSVIDDPVGWTIQQIVGPPVRP